MYIIRNIVKVDRDPEIFIINTSQSDLTWGMYNFHFFVFVFFYLFNQFILGIVSDSMGLAYKQFPWQKTIWMPRTNYTICPFMELMTIILYQAIPGFIFDSFLIVIKSNKRFVIVFYGYKNE